MPPRALVRYKPDRKVYAARLRRIGTNAFIATFADGECTLAKREAGALVAWPTSRTPMGILCDAAITECPRSPRRSASRSTRRAAACSSPTARGRA